MNQSQMPQQRAVSGCHRQVLHKHASRLCPAQALISFAIIQAVDTTSEPTLYEMALDLNESFTEQKIGKKLQVTLIEALEVRFWAYACPLYAS